MVGDEGLRSWRTLDNLERRNADLAHREAVLAAMQHYEDAVQFERGVDRAVLEFSASDSIRGHGMGVRLA